MGKDNTYNLFEYFGLWNAELASSNWFYFHNGRELFMK